MIKSDHHLHTKFSSDSKESIAQIVLFAKKQGLREFVITDHLDYSREISKQVSLLPLEGYVNTILKAKERYKDEIDIKLGIEIGLQKHLDLEYLRDFSFDFVIGSTHEIGLYNVSDSGYWQGEPAKKGYDDFFENMVFCLSRFSHFSVVGHLDYITRYAKYSTDNSKLQINDYQDQIKQVLRIIIEKGIGLEINTSGFRYGENRVYPYLDVLKWYKNLGGEILTIGSDAHKAEHVAMDFKVAEDMAKAAGFNHYTTFEQMQATWIPFD